MCPDTIGVLFHTSPVNTKGVMTERMRRALKLVCLPMTELAESLGVGYDTVKGWSSGRADPSPENREIFVTFIRAHAHKLLELAEDLEDETTGRT